MMGEFMGRVELSEEVKVSASQFFKAITAYERYPEVIDGFRKVKCTRKNPTEAEVLYVFRVLLKDVTYTIHVHEDPTNGVLSWNLKESDVFKENSGRWEIKSTGPSSCHVHYLLEADFKIPVPDMILNKLMSGNLPTLMKSFEKLAKKF